jgi:DNA-binding MarR family transcriptional regulator
MAENVRKLTDLNIADDYDSFSTGFLLLKVSRLVNHLYHQELASSGITPPQAAILWVLSKAEEISQTDVVRTLMLDKANVSALIRKLKTGGYVKVRQSSHDGRKSLLSLTPKGKEAMKKVEKVDKKVSMELERRVSSGDIKKVRTYFSELLGQYL